LGQKAVHRVPVIDRATGKVTKLITQSAVVKFLAQVRQLNISRYRSPDPRCCVLKLVAVHFNFTIKMPFAQLKPDFVAFAFIHVLRHYRISLSRCNIAALGSAPISERKHDCVLVCWAEECLNCSL
jgi:hypothetical protein